MPVSTSNQYQRLEPILRQTISSLEQGRIRMMQLPVTNYTHHLDEAEGHMRGAIRELLAWAAAHGITVHEAMPT